MREPASIEERAAAIVKCAFTQGLLNRQPGGNMTPVPVNPHAYNKLSDYEHWFHPQPLFKAPPPARPGFWASAGRSAVGALNRTPVPWYNRQQGLHMRELGLGDAARSFVGLSPGNSGAGNLLMGALNAGGDLVTGNPRRAWNSMGEAFTKGLSAPYQRATADTKNNWQYGLADWATGVDKGTRPGNRLKPGEFPGAIPQDMQNLLLHPIQTMQSRPPTAW